MPKLKCIARVLTRVITRVFRVSFSTCWQVYMPQRLWNHQHFTIEVAKALHSLYPAATICIERREMRFWCAWKQKAATKLKSLWRTEGVTLTYRTLDMHSHWSYYSVKDYSASPSASVYHQKVIPAFTLYKQGRDNNNHSWCSLDIPGPCAIKCHVSLSS